MAEVPTKVAEPEVETKWRIRDLEPLFCPKSVAVVGASRDPTSVGHAITRNLIFGGYSGVVYAVNPKAKSVLGLRCVPSVTAIDDEVDLAVIIVPAPFVERILLEASERGIRHFVIISAGFKETGEEGRRREERIGAIAEERSLNIIGPNCLGVINTDPKVRMNATFARAMPESGPLGLVSQSGALCTALLDYAKGIGLGFSRFVSFGNKVDVNEVDLLRALAADPYTRVILMYVEELSDGQGFLEMAHEITHSADPKPILAIKTGRTAQGAAAAASHTGSLAGSDEVYDAVMAQAGVLRVESVEELFQAATVFVDPVLPRGRRTAIVTNAGGPGIMATDACVRNNLELAHFREYTRKALTYALPSTSSIRNPVDVIGDAKHDRYRAALDAVAADDGVDQVIVIVTPQTMTDVTEIAHVIKDTREVCGKPVVACLMGLVDVSPGVSLLRQAGVPTFSFPEDCARALAAKNRFAEWVSTPARGFRRYEVNREAVRELFERERQAGRLQVVELRALEAFKHYGFPVVKYELAKSPAEAAEAAERVGFPVVMKVAGPKILHKTDVAAIELNVPNVNGVERTFEAMVSRVKQRLGEDTEIWGILVQPMVPAGKEVILGMSRDPVFGPLLMFGLGGIYTEVMRDVSFRVAPIRENMAIEMVHGTRAYRLLRGVRGEPPSDMNAIADCLLRLSQMVTDHEEIKELDINPLIVYQQGQGALVVDGRIILSEA